MTIGTDFIFHLGLTKTASTFLQRKVFHGKIDTLRRSANPGNDKKKARVLRDAFLLNSPEYWIKEGRIFLHNLIGDFNPKLGPVIISHESLYEHVPFGSIHRPQSEPHLLAARLGNIKSYAWPHGDTKAFFLFRRQADWYASIYAHMCPNLQRVSQSDFVRRVTKLIDEEFTGAHAVNYHLLFNAIKSSLGAGNVLALPYEALGEEWLWDKLRDFTNEPALQKSERAEKANINVKRGHGDSAWKVADQVQPGYKIKAMARKLGGSNLPEGLRRSLKNLLLIRNHEIRIAPDHDLEAIIKQYYKESNRQLEKNIGVSLEKYGYF